MTFLEQRQMNLGACEVRNRTRHRMGRSVPPPNADAQTRI